MAILTVCASLAGSTAVRRDDSHEIDGCLCRGQVELGLLRRGKMELLYVACDADDLQPSE
jgi:hypothetical protein